MMQSSTVGGCLSQENFQVLALTTTPGNTLKVNNNNHSACTICLNFQGQIFYDFYELQLGLSGIATVLILQCITINIVIY